MQDNDNESRVEYLLEENARLRTELIREKQVGMRPAALAIELSRMTPAERYSALQSIQAFIIRYKSKRNKNSNGHLQRRSCRKRARK